MIFFVEVMNSKGIHLILETGPIYVSDPFDSIIKSNAKCVK